MIGRPSSGGREGDMEHGHHHDHDEPHGGHRRRHGHGHSHGVVDPSIAATDRGLWALKWSFVGLTITAAIQVIVVVLSGSVGLLADTIHNFADAATAIPLGVAFWLARRGTTRRFTYGLGRVEDFAGILIILTILASALVAAYESISRLIHPQPVGLLWAVMVASVVGFVGNEAVAVFRIRVGKQIGSAALIADGYHARVDGWTSLAVFVGAVGVWGGYPLADPLVGLVISAAILVIVWQSARSILLRVLDGVEAETLDEITHAAGHAARVEEVTDVRARWIGHRLHADVSVTVPAALSVAEGHDIARDVRHQLLHHLPHLGSVMVHVDPYGQGGASHHRVGPHAHDDLPMHSHD
jgi:cation diffusion facilitator family transporter